MKRIVSVFLLCVLCTLLFASCSNGSQAPAGMQSVDCDGLPYLVYTPVQWEDKRVGNHIECMVSSSTPVRIRVSHFESDAADVQSCFQDSRAELEAIYKNFKIEEEPTAYTMGGIEGLCVSYSGKLGDDSYRFLQAMVLKDGSLYLVTYSAQTNVSTGTDLYGNYVEDAYRVIDNFSFVDAASGDASTEELETTENGLVRIGQTGTKGWNVKMYAPIGWIDESYGAFAFARSAESGASVSLTLEMTEMKTFDDYWKATANELLALYPDSQFEYRVAEEEGGASEAGKNIAFEEVTLDGRRGERIDYTLVTGDNTYACTKIAVVKDYHLYVMTFMFPSGAGDGAAIIEQICDAVKID